jgi:hypothetical protein
MTHKEMKLTFWEFLKYNPGEFDEIEQVAKDSA